MLDRVFAVIRKETFDALRDRRSLAAAFVYALFGPMVMGLALSTLARDNASGTVRLAVTGGEHAPSLVAWLGQSRAVVTPPPVGGEAAVFAAVRHGRIDAALVIPTTYAEEFRAVRPAKVRLVYDASRGRSRTMARRARALVEAWGQQTAGSRLVARGVSPSVARPIDIGEIDLSTPASRAATVLGMLPIFLLMAAFISSMNTAIDTTAGERERGSLEPLLVHPVPPLALAAGKWAPAVLLSLAGTGLTLFTARLVLDADRLQDLDVAVGLGAGDAVGLFGLLVPLALLAPALQMLAALFARSYKEAQTYLSLLLFAPTLPGFFLALGTFEPPPWMGAVPLVGQHILAARILRGEGAGPAWPLLAVVTVAGAVIAVVACARWLRDERIVFGRT